MGSAWASPAPARRRKITEHTQRTLPAQLARAVPPRPLRVCVRGKAGQKQARPTQKLRQALRPAPASQLGWALTADRQMSGDRQIEPADEYANRSMAHSATPSVYGNACTRFRSLNRTACGAAGWHEQCAQRREAPLPSVPSPISSGKGTNTNQGKSMLAMHAPEESTPVLR
jgi:hypothetical protein